MLNSAQWAPFQLITSEQLLDAANAAMVATFAELNWLYHEVDAYRAVVEVLRRFDYRKVTWSKCLWRIINILAWSHEVKLA